MFKYTNIPGLIIIEPQVFSDKRGCFFESYNKQILAKAGITCDFIQDNQSQSEYGVLRGLHFQTGEHAQAKLIRVLSGRVLDIALDIRAGSETFGQHFALELSGENKKQLFIPKGFAHGFVVLSKTAIFSYKCDTYYNPKSEAGICYNDPKLNIDWQIPEQDIIINARDKSYPSLENSDNLEDAVTNTASTIND